VISTSRLCKTFSHEGVQQHVLKNIDLEVRRGDFTVVMGASGAGKSTLLYLLSGMDAPTLGDVVFADEPLAGLSQSALAKFRRTHCGFVFQQIYLLATMSLMDNAMAAGLLVDTDRKAVAETVAGLFDQVGIPPEIRHKFPAQVSGGEGQRAGIVRALVNSPTVLFADEPTGSLDQRSGTAVLDLLTKANRSETAQTVVVVTHDLKSARRGNRVLHMRDGQITGDLELGPFNGDADDTRSERLLQFLSEMGW
jgi:putative ABC transport system ATP-binding protein